MKFKHIPLVLLSVAALGMVACGSSDAPVKPGELPSGGEKASVRQAVDVIKEHSDLIGEASGVSATLELNALGIDAKVTMPENAGTISAKANVSGKLSSAVEGLHGKSYTDVKSEVSLKDFNASVNVSATSGDKTENVIDVNLKDISVASYLSNGNGYIDLSSKGLRSAIVDVLKTIQPDIPQEGIDELMKAIPEKGYVEGVLTEKTFTPLPTTEEINSFFKTSEQEIAKFLDDYATTIDEIVTFETWSDGRLGVSFDLSAEKIAKLVAKIVMGDLADEALKDPETIPSLVELIEKFVKISSFKGSLLLNPAKALVQYALDVDVTVPELDLGAIKETGFPANTLLTAGIKLNVASSINLGTAKVNLPSDLNTYVKLNDQQPVR